MCFYCNETTELIFGHQHFDFSVFLVEAMESQFVSNEEIKKLFQFNTIIIQKYVEVLDSDTNKVLRIFPSKSNVAGMLNLPMSSISIAISSGRMYFRLLWRLYDGPVIDCK